jgi:hypothetical protein
MPKGVYDRSKIKRNSQKAKPVTVSSGLPAKPGLAKPSGVAPKPAKVVVGGPAKSSGAAGGSGAGATPRPVEAPVEVSASGEVYAANAVVRLTELTRMNLLRLHAEVDATEVRIKMNQTALATYLKSVDPEGRVSAYETELGNLRSKLRRFGDEYRTLLAALAQEHGVDMQNCSFDEETGMLHTHTTTPGNSK